MLCSPLPHHHQGYHHHHHHHHVLQQQQQKLKIQHQHQQHHHHQTRYGGEEYALDSYLWKASAQWRYSAGDPLGAQRARAAANAQADFCVITPHMRRTVLSWLVRVCRQFRYSLETWCTAAAHLDRFLASAAAFPVAPDRLQLAGLTALFLAAKSEEVEPPDVSELVSLCAGGYCGRQFLSMEATMLRALHWDLCPPTPAFFLQRLVELEPGVAGRWPGALARALVEESVCDYQLCKESNSPESLAHVVFSAVAEGVVAGDERLGVAAASEEEEAEAAEAMEGSALLQEYLKRVTVQVLRGGGAPSSAPLSQAAFGWHQEF